jgi:DNA polymerase III delta subunit
MLYIFTGSDTAAAKAEARKRAEGYELVMVGEGGEPFESMMTYIGASGLFAPKVALMVDRMLETPEGKALLEAHGEALHESDALIFLIEPDLGATEKKLLPKGAKIESFGVEEKEEERPNVFAFTDAFMAGDKKRSWIGYRRLIESGISAEEIHGALMWAVRSALLASKTKSADESGLKPFVYTKSKTAANKLGIQKVENLSRTLISTYHRARLGEGDLEMLTEMVILKK